MKEFTLTFEEAVAIVIIYGHERCSPYSDYTAGLKDKLYDEAWSMLNREADGALEKRRRFDERNK